MKALRRRLQKLEEGCCSRVDEKGTSPADLIRESRRRRLAAEGRVLEDPLPRDPANRFRTIAEIIREANARRRQRMLATETKPG